MPVLGLEEVIKNLNAKIQKIQERTASGLLRAAIQVRRAAQIKTPVVTGNLRASAYVISAGGQVAVGQGTQFPFDPQGKLKERHREEIRTVQEVLRQRSKETPIVAVGYSAVYALVVHENPNAGRAGYDPSKTTYKRGANMGKLKPAYRQHSRVGEWKFLQSALSENENRILAVIREEAGKK